MSTTRPGAIVLSAGHPVRPIGRPRPFWRRALPTLVRHVAKTMPWATLLAGCLAGTALLALLAHLADTSHSPLGQNQVRLTFLPAIAALAFVPRTAFRPVSQVTPVPAGLATFGQTLLAVPILALTGWGQIVLMNRTVPTFTTRPPAAVYPLVAQLAGWCALTVAAAACCDRSRYARLGGAVAAPVSLALIALAWYTPGISTLLDAPPAPSHAATIGWYVTTAAALVLTYAATRDSWQRYGRRRSMKTRLPS